MWADSFYVKSTVEFGQREAKYTPINFCSNSCADIFWNITLKYPLADIGTSIPDFGKNLRKVFYSAILDAFKREDNPRVDVINRIKWAIENETIYIKWTDSKHEINWK